ncbi:MAG: phosphoribosylaminoimidazolesuccinocarboxamide synthase [Candidatus Helarchaeota archaeon]
MSGIKLGKKIAEGKTKIVYESDNPNEVILEFKDDITAGDGLKHDVLKDKGHINCAISSKIFQVLENEGIATHFVKYMPPRHMVVKKVEMIPVEIVCRRIAWGHLLNRLPIKPETKFKPNLVEFFYKDDEKHDPLVNDDHLRILNVATLDESKKMKEIALKVSQVLAKYFDSIGIFLADFKIECGRDAKNNLLVADEVNGDSCRLWMKDGNILDKDVYRKGKSLDVVRDTYIKLYEKIIGEKPNL